MATPSSRMTPEELRSCSSAKAMKLVSVNLFCCSKTRDYTKSRSLSSSDSTLKSTSLSSSTTSSRRPSATSLSLTSPALDISRYSPANYVTGSSRSSSTASISGRPPRTSYSSLRESSSYVPSSLRSSRYADQVSYLLITT